jgi:hypothetical protein
MLCCTTTIERPLREGGLTGQGRIIRQAATGQLEERIMPQGIGIVLLLIAAGELEDPLPDERLKRVLDRAGAPVRDGRSKDSAEPEGGIGFRQPGETAIRGQVASIEAGNDGQRTGIGKAEGGVAD